MTNLTTTLDCRYYNYYQKNIRKWKFPTVPTLNVNKGFGEAH